MVDAGERVAAVTTLQTILNMVVILMNGLAIFAIGWFIDRRRASFRMSGEGIIRATIIAAIFAATVWFASLFYFGGRVNLYGTALMGGTGGGIAILLAIRLYRRRRRRPKPPLASEILDTFS